MFPKPSVDFTTATQTFEYLKTFSFVTKDDNTQFSCGLFALQRSTEGTDMMQRRMAAKKPSKRNWRTLTVVVVAFLTYFVVFFCLLTASPRSDC